MPETTVLKEVLRISVLSLFSYLNSVSLVKSSIKKDTFVIEIAALQASRVSWIGLNWKSMIKWN